MSKRLLKEALMEVLCLKPIEKITIYEICKNAGVNRSTFYKHYGSQYDLLNDIENDMFKQIETCLIESKAKDYRDGIKNLLTQVMLTHKSMNISMKKLPNNTIQKEFTEKILAMPQINDLIKGYASDIYSDWEKEYLKIFFCTGAYSILEKWADNGMPESVDLMTDLIVKMGGNLLTNTSKSIF
ncbi:TetR family transcriptional regulator [Clostridia bacterium]|nr:TetR family transcriptional regulator [Clostridia bacterium]